MSIVDDYCEAWDACSPINPDDESRTCVVFSISIHVSFIYPPPESEDEEHDFLNLVETEGEDRVFEVERDVLINGDDEDKSRSTVQEMLSSMDVPERPFMVDIILNCARSMANKESYKDRKVLRMNVSVSVVGNEQEQDHEPSETAELEGPASEESIQALEIVRVVEQQCGICLEEFSGGVEARRMPCSHVFHGHCIVNWLHIRNFCPLCRFQLN
ncbi:hypothetical protein Dsin_032333 [Dipteronia sinensis]|uniref:RING-type E3 ubiquitin transferase n=1 Tax=Dipteronia sinensis TaxID=43782 RepID=A0AAD9ZNC4_9ROSI|nr:hypothetical protein Dsin_032333 [Dipteronia sinensis]